MNPNGQPPNYPHADPNYQYYQQQTQQQPLTQQAQNPNQVSPYVTGYVGQGLQQQQASPANYQASPPLNSPPPPPPPPPPDYYQTGTLQVMQHQVRNPIMQSPTQQGEQPNFLSANEHFNLDSKRGTPLETFQSKVGQHLKYLGHKVEQLGQQVASIHNANVQLHEDMKKLHKEMAELRANAQKEKPMAKETAILQNEAVAPGGANMEQVLKALEELKKGIAEGDGGKREATEKKPPPDPAPVKMSKQKQTPVTPPPSPKVIMKTLRRQYQPVGAKETAKGCPASIPKKQTEPKQCKTPHKPAPVKGNAPEEKISGGIANRVAEIANMLNFHTQPD